MTNPHAVGNIVASMRHGACDGVRENPLLLHADCKCDLLGLARDRGGNYVLLLIVQRTGPLSFGIERRGKAGQSLFLLDAADGLQQLTPIGANCLVVDQIQGFNLPYDRYIKASFGDKDSYIKWIAHRSSQAPNFINMKCVRSTGRDAVEQRDHHRFRCRSKCMGSQETWPRSGESTGSAIKVITALTTEV